MLRAGNRVLKPGGLLALFVVSVTEDLSTRERERAVEAGPEHVGARSSYRELTRGSGFRDVEIIDVTDEYAETLSASIRVRDAATAELEDLLGAEAYADGQESRRRELAAVHDGLLKRSLITAVRP